MSNSFRQEADGLYFDTPGGPIKLTSDSSLGRDEMCFVAPSPIPKEVLEQQERMVRSLFADYGVPAHIRQMVPTCPGHNGIADLGPSAPVDPIDVEYDGVTLRDLLAMRQCIDRERDIGAGSLCSIPWRNADPWTWTPAQRAAVSAHWSAELRAKVARGEAADRARERNLVTVDTED